LKSQPKVETQTNAGGKATKTKVVETPTPTPEVDTIQDVKPVEPIPTIKATPSMTLGKPSVQ